MQHTHTCLGIIRFLGALRCTVAGREAVRFNYDLFAEIIITPLLSPPPLSFPPPFWVEAFCGGDGYFETARCAVEYAMTLRFDYDKRAPRQLGTWQVIMTIMM